MKTNKITNKLIIIALISISITLTSCSKTSKNNLFEVPVLLERNALLNDSIEVGNIQRRYNKALIALALKEDDSEALLELAEIFMNEARITGEHPYYYPAAVLTINKAMKNKTITTDLQFRALSAKAAVEMSLHQFATAKATAEQAKTINPYNAGIYGVLVDANVELGNYKEAIANADKMTSIRPDLRSYSRISYLREIHGDIPGAIEAMQMAIEAGFPGQESTAWAGFTLGKMLENYGDLTKAKQVYEGVLAERPNYAFAVAGLGSIAIANKDYKTAEERLNAAIAIMPEVSFYHSLADMHSAMGNKTESEKIAKEMLEMIKEDEAAGHEMSLEKAYVYLHLLNDAENALLSAQKEYKVRPLNIDVNRCMAEVYTQKQAWDMAKTHLELALITGSKLPEIKRLQKLVASKTVTKSSTLNAKMPV